MYKGKGKQRRVGRGGWMGYPRYQLAHTCTVCKLVLKKAYPGNNLNWKICPKQPAVHQNHTLGLPHTSCAVGGTVSVNEKFVSCPYSSLQKREELHVFNTTHTMKSNKSIQFSEFIQFSHPCTIQSCSNTFVILLTRSTALMDNPQVYPQLLNSRTLKPLTET